MDIGLKILKDLDELINEYHDNELKFEENRSSIARESLEKSLDKINNTVYWIRENLDSSELAKILDEEPVDNESVIKDFLTNSDFDRKFH